jgi:hypothetical protein
MMNLMGETNITQDNTGLQTLLISELRSGSSYNDLAAKHGIPVLEVFSLVQDYLNAAPKLTVNQHRQMLSLTLEAVISKMWAGLEAGSFKHAEVVLKTVHELAELNALIDTTIVHELRVIEDKQATIVLKVVEGVARELYERVLTLPLNQKAKAALTEWEVWAADATTDAVEATIYAEEVE